MSRVVKISDLESQLMSRIDPDDLIEVDKVMRYIAIVKQIRKLQTAINKGGVMTTTINGNQEFTKANPAINELNKLTKTLITLENSIKFEMFTVPEKNKDAEKDNDGPEVSDLY
ncbi:P27 family phage terminase small subunit [Peribacillus simplex]|uniref:P27 family phage terminase small subunit n=1 Tax=Peribacillus simplex TaxID=1478 RepID=UPI0021A9D396|nr:P27 family phage terminase small subunit [Peribacillus simplex]